MSKQTVGIGTAANDGTGDPLRVAFQKINGNFDEVYASIAGLPRQVVPAGMLGNVMSPLVHIPFKRQNDEVALSGTQTFTRASTGTYIDPLDGLVKTAAIDTPRFERMADGGIGILLEGASTNEMLYSEDFSVGGAKLAASITTNVAGVVDPFGGNNADALVEDGTNAEHSTFRAAKMGVTGDWDTSVYVKAGTRTWCAIYNPMAFGPPAYFDLANGVWGNTNGITVHAEHIGNGWYRLDTAQNIASAATVYLQISAASGDNGVVYTGTAGAESLYLFGRQTEALPFASSYIPTTTAPVTRAADVLNVAAANTLAPDAAITVIMDFDIIGVNGVLNQRLYTEDGIVYRTMLASLGGVNYHTNFMPGLIFGGVPLIGVVRRMAAINDLTNVSAWLDGISQSSAASGTLTGLTTSIYIGCFSPGVESLFGHIRNFRIYDRALTDAEIAAA